MPCCCFSKATRQLNNVNCLHADKGEVTFLLYKTLLLVLSVIELRAPMSLKGHNTEGHYGNVKALDMTVNYSSFTERMLGGKTFATNLRADFTLLAEFNFLLARFDSFFFITIGVKKKKT